MWVKRLLAKQDEGSWKIYPQRLLSKLLHNYSFQCNFELKKVKFLMQPFYKQLFEAWGKVKEDSGEDPFKLRREIIWMNRNITIAGKVVCYKDWYKNGIILMHDILKEDGDFKSILDLEAEHNIQIKVMDYNSLLDAIPAAWKRALKKMKIPTQAISNQEQPYLTCSNRLLALGIISNRDIYWEMIAKKKIKPICVNKWCTTFNIEAEDWKSIFKLYANIKDTRTKTFQFKILNSLLPCNLYLKRIGKSDTDKCTKCNLLDDQTHYLIECHEVASIWKHLTRWWKGLTNQEIILSSRDITLGLESRPQKIVKKAQLDEIILAVKWRIYANKQLEEDTCFYQILCSIRNMIYIQKLIARRKNKDGEHSIIWGEISDYLT